MIVSKLLGGVVALTFFAGVALAEPLKESHDSDASAKQTLTLSHQQKRPATQPMKLNEKQMDQVTAGGGAQMITTLELPYNYPKQMDQTTAGGGAQMITTLELPYNYPFMPCVLRLCH